jgi:hypothetical protein
MLQGFRAAGGALDARLAELAAGRAFNPQRNHHQLPPYPEADWEKLTRSCRSIVDEAFARHRSALAAAERVVIRANTGGQRRICADCLRISARSGSSHSANISAAQTTWFGNEAVSWMPAGTCSRVWCRVAGGWDPRLPDTCGDCSASTQLAENGSRFSCRANGLMFWPHVYGLALGSPGGPSAYGSVGCPTKAPRVS